MNSMPVLLLSETRFGSVAWSFRESKKLLPVFFVRSAYR